MSYNLPDFDIIYKYFYNKFQVQKYNIIINSQSNISIKKIIYPQ